MWLETPAFNLRLTIGRKHTAGQANFLICSNQKDTSGANHELSQVASFR